VTRLKRACCGLVLLLAGSPVFGSDNADLRLLPPLSEEISREELAAAQTPEASTAEDIPEPEEVPPPADAGSQAEGADELALAHDSISWQDWLTPAHWQLPPGWNSSFEVGLDGSEGNATTLSFRTGTNIKRKVDWSDLKIALNYVKATAEYRETKHNAQLEIHHDWVLGESRWSPFVKSILVYDEFRPFRLELTLNAGIGYRFVDSESTTLKGRFGSGASRRFRGSDNTWEPEAMFGLDLDHKLSSRQKVRATVEYYPEWSDFEMYRVRADAGWEVLLDEATNMSLKLGVINRYDTRDSGPRPNALDYTLLLLWKL
jgi:putative salt-induced outer membrane protein YdiY